MSLISRKQGQLISMARQASKDGRWERLPLSLTSQTLHSVAAPFGSLLPGDHGVEPSRARSGLACSESLT